MPKTVLLTGATGYIAKHIALQLLEAGYHVRGTVRSLDRGAEVAAAVRPHLSDPTDLQTRLTFTSLDLSSDTGWDAAMTGIDVLMHTASPFPLTQPKDEEDLIRPAVDGTLRALTAAHEAGVKRVILTSSTVAITGSDLPAGDTSYDETNWTDPNAPDATPYVKSKTLAERAAWDFVSNEASDMQLTTVNPGIVLGAPLDGNFGTSIDVIKRLVKGKDPMLPDIGFTTVDVRDVAEMHVAVIDKPYTFGQRVMTVDKFLKYAELAQAIKSAYPDRRIPTRTAPDFLIKILGRFDPAVKSIIPSLGRVDKTDNSRARAILGRGMRQAHKAAVASAAYLIDNKLV
ncbi:SDR family oxidoreductase [Yoonia litorea]|uniref:Dihydroflavonol-4-reductase n=1 Tax=Yoonia litorea TaxID=1123755 RepID=A0A1I6MXU4_9RHOB|nr:aldehyde reductase [Yoonia litorea]SFS20447.1 dihydroflavonol-4-reductase [Yoonia litorea]